MSTGKRYERECVRELRGLGLTAERVPRSVADATPVDDIVAVQSGTSVMDHPDRPITRALQNQLIDLSDIFQIECKYTSNSAHGIATLLEMHKRTVGLGWPQAVVWASCDPVIYSGGTPAFVTALEDNDVPIELWATDDSLPKGTKDLLDDADAAAIRASGEPWVFVWRSL